MRRTLRLLALILPLAACQLFLPGRDAAPGTGNPVAETPITGGTITTTPLDATPAPPAPQAATTPPPARPASAQDTAVAAPLPAPVATPIPKSEAQIACEKKDGSWVLTGEGAITETCVTRTRDGSRRCDAKSDCEGECLARSRTCAPVKPLFGCNAVLMDNGAEVTLCLN